jgi:UDP-glucuronate decarboxylase
VAAPVGSVPRRCPDLIRLREITGYEPAVALEDGVRSTYSWYRENGWPA